jgi:hypothetical protein
MNLPSRVKKKIRVMLPLLAITGLLGASLSAPRLARASTGQIFLETMGISIAVGTVLGASTLPFYDQPGTHLMNLAYGASVGAVAGLGWFAYRMVEGSRQDDYGQAGDLSPSSQTRRGQFSATTLESTGRGRASRVTWPAGPAISQGDYVAPRSRSPYPAQFWTPLVSLNW